MIVYGSRMYGRKNNVQSWGFCTNCDKYVKQSSYRGRKWSHVYFIPIFPEGPHVHVIRECKKCGFGLHVPADEMPGMIDGIRKDIDECVEQLLKGEEFYTVKDENGDDVKISCSATLIDDAELLRSTGNDDIVDELLAKLEKNKLRKVHCLVKGKCLEFEGKLEEAVLLYEETTKNYPDFEDAYWMLGLALYNQGKVRESCEVYEKLLDISSDKPRVFVVLLDTYETLKEYLTLTETFEACFNEFPIMAKDSKFIKRYKKACKKAGVRPKEALLNFR